MFEGGALLIINHITTVLMWGIWALFVGKIVFGKCRIVIKCILRWLIAGDSLLILQFQ